MYLLSISDDQYQTFSAQLDAYTVVFHLRCPEPHPVTGEVNIPPVLDVYIEGYEPVYGVPLVPFVDVLGGYVGQACLPIDLGAIIPLPDENGEITCESLAGGRSALAYLNGAESFAIGNFT